jgi:hypothetical protein
VHDANRGYGRRPGRNGERCGQGREIDLAVPTAAGPGLLIRELVLCGKDVGPKIFGLARRHLMRPSRTKAPDINRNSNRF